MSDDFVQMGYIGEQPFAIGAAASLPVNSLAELVEYSKKTPEGFNAVAGAQGGLQHMSLEWFRSRSKANPDDGALSAHNGGAQRRDVRPCAGGLGFSHQPERSDSDRQDQAACRHIAETLGHLPADPTGFRHDSGFAAQGWLTLVGPNGLPHEIAQKLNNDLRAAFSRPELQKKYETLGTFTRQMSLKELSDFVRAGQEQWRPIVRQIRDANEFGDPVRPVDA
jgi:tripartite-type tricarboxylate transporter receptor subunit TctC